MKRERFEETEAARVVGNLLGVEPVLRDVAGAPPGTHDFDLRRGGEVVGALEVTVLLDESRQQLSAALDKYSPFTDSKLTKDWYVALDCDASIGLRVSELRERLVPMLIEFEATEMWEVEENPYHWPPKHPFGDLPIVYAHASSMRSQVGTVFMLGLGSSGSVWSGNTHMAVQQALKSDSLLRKGMKLKRSNAERRILFVWIDPSMFAAYVGMDLSEELPDEAPSIPVGATEVWMASSGGRVVWRSTGGAWERVHVLRET